MIENIKVNLKDSLFYYNKSEDDDYKNIYELEFMIDNKYYEIGLNYKSDSKLEDKLNLKAKIEKNIDKIGIFSFNTIGYEQDIESYYHHFDYDNFNYDREEFYTQSMYLDNKYLKTYIERDEETQDVTVLNKIQTTYFEAFVDNELNKSDINYELVLKNSFFDNKLGVSGGYTSIVKDDYLDQKQDVYLYNLKADYGNKKWGLDIEYERKNRDKMSGEISDIDTLLYDNVSSKFKYMISENATFYYKIGYFDTEMDGLFNHNVILKNETKKITTYFSYSRNNIDKDNYINNTISQDQFDKENDYSEIILKLNYLLMEGLDINISYKEKKYNVEDLSEVLYFIKVDYLIDQNIQVYFKYLQNDAKYFDRVKDINYNRKDLDFDSDSGIIEEVKDGRIEIGIELKF